MKLSSLGLGMNINVLELHGGINGVARANF
jgi:hypothetical protein